MKSHLPIIVLPMLLPLTFILGCRPMAARSLPDPGPGLAAAATLAQDAQRHLATASDPHTAPPVARQEAIDAGDDIQLAIAKIAAVGKLVDDDQRAYASLQAAYQRDQAAWAAQRACLKWAGWRTLQIFHAILWIGGGVLLLWAVLSALAGASATAGLAGGLWSTISVLATILTWILSGLVAAFRDALHWLLARWMTKATPASPPTVPANPI